MNRSSVRVTGDVFRRLRAVARERGMAPSLLTRQHGRRGIQPGIDIQMVEAAELLAADPEEAGVEFAFSAQSKVVLNERP